MLTSETTLKLKYNILSFPTLRVNYWAIPKCGNTSVKCALLSVACPTIVREYAANQKTDVNKWVHSITIPGLCTYISPSTAHQTGYKNFTVVRSPIHRLWSTYNDFVFKRPAHVIGGSRRFKEGFKLVRSTKSMNELVTLLEACPNEERDVHFKTQSYFCSLCDGDVLKLSNITRTISSIVPTASVDGIQLHRTDDMKILPNEALLHRIYKLYRVDFDLWERAR